MPSESVAGFLDNATASRVLFPEQVEQLIRQPDIPQSNLDSLCEYLLARGVLTRFQAAAIREARSADLSYAGYPVIDELGPCPGGTAYKALHPSLRTPLVLRRLRADWLGPADNPTNYVERARSFGMIAHPNVVHLLDAGVHDDEVYVVIDHPADAADLASLAREIGGAMPGFLAAEYGRAVASALRSAHERGGAHGDVRPENLVVGPLAVKPTPEGTPRRRRPAPDAVVRLAELGLVPVRSSAAGSGVTPYLPPERLDVTTATATVRGDLYGLGASLYFLLAGRPPFPADGPDLANKIRSAAPDPLSALRPDLPPEFVSLVGRMMEKQPDRRPATAYEVEAALIKFCRPGVVPPTPVSVPMAVPASTMDAAHPVVEVVPVAPEAPAEEGDGWGVGAFDTSHAADDSAPSPRRKRQGMTDAERTRGRMLIILGGLLHLTAITLLVLWLTGVFEPSPPPPSDNNDTKPPRQTEPKPGQPKPKNKNLNG